MNLTTWVAIAVAILVPITSACNLIEPKENYKSPKAILPINEKMSNHLEEFSIDWYKSISSIMIDDKNLVEKEVVQEYIIANSLSFRGIEHIDIRVFADETGELINKFYSSEFEGEGEMVVNETHALTKEQTNEILQIFTNNNFWKIPSKHPEEVLGLDGYTIFIEGTDGNKYNLISMWLPDDRYEIKRIYNEIMIFAEKLGLKANMHYSFTNY